MTAFDELPLVIEPADLATRLHAPDLILVDLSSHQRYLSEHIPGARFVDGKRTQASPPSVPGLLPEKAQLEQLFSELGHHPQATYVVYDDEGGGWAGRFIWLLDVIGHGRYHFLNGGLTAWEAEGRPLSQDVPALHETTVSLTLSDAPTASAHGSDWRPSTRKATRSRASAGARSRAASWSTSRASTSSCPRRR